MMIFSSSSGFICPCPIATRASGTYLCIISASRVRSLIRLFTKYTCPFLLSSKRMASATISALKVCISVCMGYLLGGGVCMMLRSRAPTNENCRVRGIGVALMVSVSTFTFICFSFSLVATPNFCSSSMISSPRSLNFTCLPISLCVPTTISTLPSSKSLSRAVICLALLALVI